MRSDKSKQFKEHLAATPLLNILTKLTSTSTVDLLKKATQITIKLIKVLIPTTQISQLKVSIQHLVAITLPQVRVQQLTKRKLKDLNFKQEGKPNWVQITTSQIQIGQHKLDKICNGQRLLNSVVIQEIPAMDSSKLVMTPRKIQTEEMDRTDSQCQETEVPQLKTKE